jgi:hypothetical protein
MIRIAFLAIAQAHQHLHWIAAARALAARSGVEVSVLGSSRAGLELVRRFDADRRLKLVHLPTPSKWEDGLFTPPPRRLTALLHHLRLMRFDAIVTTETTSSVLRRVPWFRVPLIHLKHGAGDSEVGYNPKHSEFDLTLVNGPKDKERLIAKGLATEDEIAVVGYSKFELVAPPEPLFANDRPVALYNPHARPGASSWFDHGPAIMAALEKLQGWNVVVAPHVKLKGGPPFETSAPHVLVDTGSIRSIDMSYTQGADVYIGDASSQVYEFIRRPRPCIFLNLDKAEWRDVEKYSHWAFGQVVEDLSELQAVLDRAAALQPRFEAAQREAFERSIDPSPVPASERQADAILEFVRSRR